MTFLCKIQDIKTFMFLGCFPVIDVNRLYQRSGNSGPRAKSGPQTKTFAPHTRARIFFFIVCMKCVMIFHESTVDNNVNTKLMFMLIHDL